MGMQCDHWAAMVLLDPVFQIYTQANSLFSFFTAPSWKMHSPKSSEKIPVRPTAKTWPEGNHRRRLRISATGWVREKLSLGSANSWVTTRWSAGCLALLSWWLRQSCRGDLTARYCIHKACTKKCTVEQKNRFKLLCILTLCKRITGYHQCDPLNDPVNGIIT